MHPMSHPRSGMHLKPVMHARSGMHPMSSDVRHAPYVRHAPKGRHAPGVGHAPDVRHAPMGPHGALSIAARRVSRYVSYLRTWGPMGPHGAPWAPSPPVVVRRNFGKITKIGIFPFLVSKMGQKKVEIEGAGPP